MSQPPPPGVPAGWYPDPNGKTQRYWDGSKWTDQLAPLAADTEYSTKSSAVAGLLQFFLGWFGAGRFYVGSIILGVIQLVLGLLGLITLPLFGFGLFILIPLSVWVFIEGIVMFAGGIRDSEGRKLR